MIEPRRISSDGGVGRFPLFQFWTNNGRAWLGGFVTGRRRSSYALGTSDRNDMTLSMVLSSFS